MHLVTICSCDIFTQGLPQHFGFQPAWLSHIHGSGCDIRHGSGCAELTAYRNPRESLTPAVVLRTARPAHGKRGRQHDISCHDLYSRPHEEHCKFLHLFRAVWSYFQIKSNTWPNQK